MGWGLMRAEGQELDDCRRLWRFAFFFSKKLAAESNAVSEEAPSISARIPKQQLVVSLAKPGQLGLREGKEDRIRTTVSECYPGVRPLVARPCCQIRACVSHHDGVSQSVGIPSA